MLDNVRHGSKDAEALIASRALLHRALELDPGYAAARASLGMTYIVDFVQNLTGRATVTDVETGLSESRQAVRLDPNLAVGYQVLSFGLSATGDYPGAMHVSSNRLANPFDLAGSELDVIAAVILGGARITGGSGTVLGTLLGVLLITLVNNVLILVGIPSTLQLAIIGLFILAAGAMAASVIVTVPLVVLVLIFQRRIISGLTAGGVKG